MKFKIDSSGLATRCVLTVDTEGVKISEGSILSNTKKFRFGQIDCILLSGDHVLSFQVGQEVFKVSTKPTNEKHQQAIAMLVQQVRLANGLADGF